MNADRPPGEQADFAGETDSDLMAYMAMAAEDARGARAAWAQFYRRHAEYLYGVCLRAYGPLLGGQAGVCDLVADTFKRAYEHAGKFDAGGIDDRERLRLRTRAWLGRIAQRLVQTALRGRSRLVTRQLEHEAWQNVASPPQAREIDPSRARRVREAIDSLSEREQLVVRVTFQWYEPGREHQRLPNDVAAELAETLQTTPENLRQMRRRALKKIKDYLGRQEGG